MVDDEEQSVGFGGRGARRTLPLGLARARFSAGALHSHRHRHVQHHPQRRKPSIEATSGFTAFQPAFRSNLGFSTDVRARAVLRRPVPTSSEAVVKASSEGIGIVFMCSVEDRPKSCIRDRASWFLARYTGSPITTCTVYAQREPYTRAI